MMSILYQVNHDDDLDDLSRQESASDATADAPYRTRPTNFFEEGFDESLGLTAPCPRRQAVRTTCPDDMSGRLVRTTCPDDTR